MHAVAPGLDDLAQLAGHDPRRAWRWTSGWNRQQCATISDAPAAGRRLDHRVAFGDRGGHRLLDQDVLPGLEQRDRLRGVQRVGRATIRRIDRRDRDARASQSVVTRAMSWRSAKVRADLLPMVRDGDHLMPARDAPPRAWKSWIHPQPNSATRIGRR